MTIRPLPPILIDHVKSFEGLHDGDKSTPILEAERCPAGFWTVGWGHLVTRNRKAPEPAPITLEEADRLLHSDLAKAARSVSRLITVPLTDGQYAALVDFAYNCGAANLQASTLRRVINRGDYDEAPSQFLRWIYASGRRLRGLQRRRQAEVELWNS